jgi:amino acid adenylation domain-containing protein
MLSKLLKKTQELGIKFYLDDNSELKVIGKTPLLDAELLQAMREHKAEIIAWFEQEQLSARPTVTVRGKRDAIPVSYAQKRLWIIDQINGGTPEYNMVRPLRVKGKFDVDAAEKAIVQLIARHSTLRTVLEDLGAGPLQVIRDNVNFKLERYDLSALEQGEQECQLAEILHKDRYKKFDLKNDVMMRACFIYLDKSTAALDGVLIFTTHHIASDGWSMNILIGEFCQLYLAYTQGLEAQLPRLELQYSDYSVWQQEGMQGKVKISGQYQYWQEQLKDLPVVHSLVLDKPRPQVKEHIGASVFGKLPSKTVELLGNVAKQFRMTPFMLVHAALSVVLSRNSESSDIVIGTPVANRMQAELKPLVGFFINILILRANTSEQSIANYLQHIRQVNVDALHNQEVSFDELVDFLNAPRDSSYTPLFQIILNVESNFENEAEKKIKAANKLSDVTFSSVPDQDLPAKYDINLAVNLSETGMDIHWIYDVSIFNEERVAVYNQQFERVLFILSESSTDYINENSISALLSVSSEDEQYLLETIQSAPLDLSDISVYQQIMQSEKRYSNYIAVQDNTTAISYKDLILRTNGIAIRLQQAGIGNGDYVGVLTGLNVESVVAILGVMAAGAAYVPLDANQPEKRLEFMVDNVKAKALLTPKTYFSKAEIMGNDIIKLVSEEIRATEQKVSTAVSLSQPAYAIYTSGSTGEPKAVQVNHYNLLSFVEGFKHSHDFTGQRLLMIPPLFFDASIGDIFPALTSGSTLVLHPNPAELGARELIAYIEKNAITAIDAPASLWGRWTEDLVLLDEPSAKLAGLKMVMFGGEAVTVEQVKKFAQLTERRVQLYNHYGPTEATVCATVLNTLDGEELSGVNIPVGKPLPGVRIYVLNKDKQLAFPGEVGEIYIGGTGVSDGYFARPEHTQIHFMHDDFSPTSNAKMYKTGDFGRWDDSGNLQFLGRLDNQVKIRGFRIELGEIEKVLAVDEQVNEVAVLALESGTAQKRLVAYITRHTHFQQDNTKEQLLTRLKVSLNESLPEYMVPQEIIMMESFPLTPNGKIDKKAFPKPHLNTVGKEYKMPTTEVQEKICDIWCDILSISKVGIDHNFFELGGHSLSLTKLITRINLNFGVVIDLKSAFNAPTVYELSQLVEDLVRNKGENTDLYLDAELIEEGVF